jgi:hypothetical protein
MDKIDLGIDVAEYNKNLKELQIPGIPHETILEYLMSPYKFTAWKPIFNGDKIDFEMETFTMDFADKLAKDMMKDIQNHGASKLRRHYPHGTGLVSKIEKV